MAYEPHKPGIWFRETNGAIHWRCHACDAILPTTCADYPGYESAWADAIQQPCTGMPDVSLPKAWKERKSRHQLGYAAHQGKIGWMRDHVYPFLPPSYEDLFPSDQDQAQYVGWNVLQGVLRALTDWHTTQLSEGELCRCLGLDRMAWRDIRDQLGMTQIEETQGEADEDHLYTMNRDLGTLDEEGWGKALDEIQEVIERYAGGPSPRYAGAALLLVKAIVDEVLP